MDIVITFLGKTLSFGQLSFDQQVLFYMVSAKMSIY